MHPAEAGGAFHEHGVIFCICTRVPSVPCVNCITPLSAYINALMTPLHDTRPEITKIDEQLIQLLSDRVQRCIELRDSGNGITSDEEEEILSYWLEEAADFELDEERMEKICQLILVLCRNSGE